MAGVRSNQFSWVHDSSIPVEERVTPTRPIRPIHSQSEEAQTPPAMPAIERFSTPQGVLVSTDREDDATIPIVQGSIISSPSLPPISNCSPSQTMAAMLNDARLEPSIWLSLASSVEERPTSKGWYLATTDSPADSDDYTVKWSRLPSQDVIEDAFLSPTSTSVMVYGAREGDDLKIDFGRFYAKRRNGASRRPVLRVVDPAPAAPPQGAVWEFNYEGSDGAVSEWSHFDAR